MEKGNQSTTLLSRDADPPSSFISRRRFLAEAAAAIALAPTLVRTSLREAHGWTVLHLATRSSRGGHIHTYALTTRGCKILGSTAVDSFAALAAHPALPILYVARDCSHWQDLPRGVVETYAVSRDPRPLRLLARTPMALSATGPRSLAVSACGRHLLVSAFTGGAWNAFALDPKGMPASVAIARKETGGESAHARCLPTPYGVAFSPHSLLAVGTDPGTERLTLLQTSSEGITIADRCQTPSGLARTQPVWMANGRYFIAAAARNASLLVFEISSAQESRMQLLGVARTATPVTALVADAVESSIVTARPHAGESVLELWKIRGQDLEIVSSTQTSGEVVSLTHDSGGLWIASHDRLTRMSLQDLGRSSSFEMRLPTEGAQSIVVQDLSI